MAYKAMIVNVDSSPCHIKVYCFWSYLLLETENQTKLNQNKKTPNLTDNGQKCQVPEALLSADNQDISKSTNTMIHFYLYGSNR